MDWETASDRAERAVDLTAAAALAAAVAFAVRALASDGAPAIGAASAIGFLLAYATLRRLPPEEPTFDLPSFRVATFKPAAELEGEANAELILDDVLDGVEPDARVVRLFDPGQAFMGQPTAPPDASEALSEALAELRRALR